MPPVGSGSSSPGRTRRLSVATRLATTVVAVTAVSVAVTSAVGLHSAATASERLVEQRLSSLRSAELFEIMSLIERMSGAVSGLADSPMTVDSIDAFASAHAQVPLPDRSTLNAERGALTDHVRTALLPLLAASSSGPVGPRDLLPETDRGVHLQHLFLPDEPGDRAADVDDPGGDSGWAAVHADLHPHHRSVAARLRVDDLYLVSADGDVVYSVEKAPDFATNLRSGPVSGRPLSTAFRGFRNGQRDAVVTDLWSYAPALGDPTWFIAAPVLDDGRFVGMVAVRLGVQRLNETLGDRSGTAADGAEGVGDSGEVYLLGADSLMRSDPRRYREAPGAYLDDAVDAGTLSTDDATLVRARRTTALVQRGDGDLVRAAAEEPTETLRRTDHLGRDALMVAVTVEAAGPARVAPTWTLVVQIDHREATAPMVDARRQLLLAVAVLMALVTFGAVAWANRLVHPVRVVSEHLRRSGAGDAEQPGPLEIDGRIDGRIDGMDTCDEFRRLVDGFAIMDTQLRERRERTRAAHDEWTSVLRSLVPPAVAARIDAGERSVFERVPSASVAVVVLRGGGSAVTDLALLDQVAERHGGERVKLVGDTCFLAVGHHRPVLDHARRAVTIAREFLEQTGSDHDHRPTVGVASGPLNVGLSGSAELVYDVWGTTAAEADALARRGRPGDLIVSDDVRARLPAELRDALEPTGGGASR